MWDDIYERLKPEIQNGSILVERGQSVTASLSPAGAKQADARMAGTQTAESDVRPPSTAQSSIDSVPSGMPGDHPSESAMAHSGDGSISEYIRVRLSDKVLFASGDDRISEDGVAVLTRLGTILKDEENIQIAIQGHTDNKPIRDRLRRRFPDNQALSQARASNAASILEHSGIPSPWLTLQWFGESYPLLPNDSEESRRKNRRVEILITPTENR